MAVSSMSIATGENNSGDVAQTSIFKSLPNASSS